MDKGAGKNAQRELSMPGYVQKSGAAKRAAYASSRAGASKKTAAKRKGGGARKRRRQRPTMRTWIAASVLVLLAAALIVLFGGDRGEAMTSDIGDNEKICEGVYLENTYIGGKSVEAARAMATELARTRLASASLSLFSQNGAYALPASEIDLSAGVDEAVEEAYACGRVGNAIENARARSELKETGKTISLRFTLREAALLSLIEEAKTLFDVSPEEPYAVPSLSSDFVQSFAFYEGKSGRALDVQATAKLVMAAVERGELSAQIEPVFTELPPAMTLDFIKENTKRISTFTTRFRAGGSEIVENRVFNIRKATDILNCHVVAPNETFSYNEVVGPRTNEGGWKDANGISGGKEYTLQAGGGVCQTSTTLYNALLCGHLTVTDRSKHSIPSDYVEKGLDATVDTSGIDLKFLNDTGAPVYIFMYIKPDPNDSKYLTITVSLYGKPLPEGVTYKPRSVITASAVQDQPIYTEDAGIPRGYQLVSVQPHDGFTAEAYLDKYVNGVLEGSEYLHTDKYRGNPAEIRIGTGDPAALAVPPGATPVSPGATDAGNG
ncbi:MAG: VanW family protein [Clostridiaceae bacterium]|nr:VanW family protein [Eubacteriales bacterium]